MKPDLRSGFFMQKKFDLKGLGRKKFNAMFVTLQESQQRKNDIIWIPTERQALWICFYHSIEKMKKY